MVQTMQTVDWIVIAGYGLGMLLIGFYYSVKAKTSDEYMLGGRHMKSWAVGLSLFATLFSAISYMSCPGEMIKYGPMLFCGLLSIPLIYWVVGWFLIPAFMKLNITSANELLEQKLGVSLRVLAAVLFLLMRLLWMSVVIYLCAVKIIVPLMNWGPTEAVWVSIVIGMVTVIYTSMGGLQAVVVTDVIQTLILFGAAIVSLVLIGKEIGGPSHWIPEKWPDGWVHFTLFDIKARGSLFIVMLSNFMWNVCTAGSDQMAVQRYLATKDVKSARRGFLISQLSALVVVVLLLLLGLGLLAYFKNNLQLLGPGQTIINSADQLFPRFILIGLPIGVTGLVVAGLMAAAMSSLSSGVNSSCLIISKDFFQRFSKKSHTQKQQVYISKIISVVVGVIVIAGSLAIGRIKGNLYEMSFKTANLLVAPLFVPFFMALFVKRTHERAVFWGTILSAATACCIAFSKELLSVAAYCHISVPKEFAEVEIPFIWIMPVSFIVGVLSSLLFNYIMPRKQRKPETSEISQS